MKQIVVHQLADVPFAAKEILEYVGHRKVIAFYAPMGAGKTTLITAILRAMGITELAGSPTYSLVNAYHAPYYGDVFHFDVYRIQSVEEAIDAGLEEIIYGGGVCLIEWAELIEPLLPEDTIRLTMSVNAAGERLIQLD